jgi:tetratricopeptide (TPR) repeat protein
MRKLQRIFLSLSLVCFASIAFAQKAKISSAQMYLNDGKVMDAKKEIDAALQSPEIQTRVDAWATKGDVYRNIYEVKIFYPQNPTALFDAKDAYFKAIELEANPKKQKAFTTSLNNLEVYFFNEGLGRFNNKNYEDAYKHFAASSSINDLLLSKGFTTTVDTNAIYATAMAGINANKIEEVIPILQKLIDMDYNNASIYESLAQIYEARKNKEELAKILTKGRAKFPNNKNLEIHELNSTLDNSDIQASIDKFATAFKNDPTNASIAFNLGVLYDKIQNIEKTKEFYGKAIELKPDYGDAYYNLGVMYFNAGVAKNKEMNSIDDAKDKDGKIYDRLKSERDALFKQALPNLEKAHEIDPKNPDYKQNLKKVYASMNMLDKAKALGE